MGLQPSGGTKSQSLETIETAPVESKRGSHALRSAGTSRKEKRDAEFRAFFEAESERLCRLGTFMTGDYERGADLAQEAMVRTYKHWDRIKSVSPGPYARRILVNLLRSQHRRSLLERKHRALQTEDQVMHPTPGVDDWLIVSKALAQLSPIRRATVVLRFWEDMSEADIASTLKRPIGTVKSDIHRALGTLRPLLGNSQREQ